MATASCYPTRSVSFPSRSNPNSLQIDQTVNNLNSLDSSSSASTSGSVRAETIQLGLLGLVELYGHLQQLILSPSTQKSLLRHEQGKLVEEALESSVGLIDTCSNLSDLILRFKQQVRDLQSALRRKGCLSVEREINAYVGFRKKMAKDITRCLKVLKQAETKYVAPLSELDPCVAMVARQMRDVHAVSNMVLKSLFMFLSSVPTNTRGWSLVISRIMVAKRSSGVVVSHKGIVNEVVEVDEAIIQCMDDKKGDVLLVRGRIHALDASIQIVEEELECVSRCLVHNRVSLLNILTQTQ